MRNREGRPAPPSLACAECDPGFRLSQSRLGKSEISGLRVALPLLAMRSRFSFLAAALIAAACSNVSDDDTERFGRADERRPEVRPEPPPRGRGFVRSAAITDRSGPGLPREQELLPRDVHRGQQLGRADHRRALAREGISPVYMLARIQGESGLVEAKKPTTKSPTSDRLRLSGQQSLRDKTKGSATRLSARPT